MMMTMRKNDDKNDDRTNDDDDDGGGKRGRKIDQFHLLPNNKMKTKMLKVLLD